MNAYLVQHAEAKDKEVDPDRPLSERGRREAERVAAVAGRLGLEIGQIRHSGKLRAEQTAQILGEALSPDEGVVAAKGLGALDDVEPVANDLDTASAPVMLVGHLPFMERLIGELVVGDPDEAIVDVQNAAITCLSENDGAWQVSWILTPEMA
ncbi:MAG: phosphohistidine phosphatase SixA, partial [Anaerolineae bacterium]